MGGVGKTRLTVALIDQTASDFTGGTAYLSITDLTRLDDLRVLLLDHLSLPRTAPDHAIQDKIAAMRVLIVLDNAEECPSDERRKIADWLKTLDSNGGSHIVISGRDVWGEFRLAPSHRLEAPTHADAVAILRNMAGQKGIADTIAGQESIIAAAARNHPRLLEYTVVWLARYPVEEVLAILKDLKGKDAEKALEDMVHRTLARMAQKDGEESRVALRKLAVCRGGFTTAAAKALIGAELHPLGVLVKWNLATTAKDRYALDPLALTAVQPEADDYRPHYAYYEALAWQHDKKQDYLGLDSESDNLTAAFEWALKMGDGEDALNLANASGQFLLNRGRVRLWVDWCERTAAKLQVHPDKALWGNVQNSLGNAYRDLSELEDRAANLNRAIAAFTEALRFHTPEAAPQYYAATQNNLGTAYSDLAGLEERAANLNRAIAAYTQALRFYTPEAAPLDYAMTQNNLGAAYAELSELEDRAANLNRAIAAFTEALRFRTPQTAPSYYADTQRNLGLVYKDMGDLKAAVACWREAEIYYRQMGYIEKADLMLRWRVLRWTTTAAPALALSGLKRWAMWRSRRALRRA